MYRIKDRLESSHSPHTSAKAMLFARWQHHLRFRSGLPYAPLKAMVTKISKWFRIQHSFRITPKIESLVVFAILDMPSKSQKDPSRTFWVILLTHRQTNKVWQKHGGKYSEDALKMETTGRHQACETLIWNWFDDDAVLDSRGCQRQHLMETSLWPPWLLMGLQRVP